MAKIKDKNLGIFTLTQEEPTVRIELEDAAYYETIAFFVECLTPSPTEFNENQWASEVQIEADVTGGDYVYELQYYVANSGGGVSYRKSTYRREEGSLAPSGIHLVIEPQKLGFDNYTLRLDKQLAIHQGDQGAEPDEYQPDVDVRIITVGKRA